MAQLIPSIIAAVTAFFAAYPIAATIASSVLSAIVVGALSRIINKPPKARGLHYNNPGAEVAQRSTDPPRKRIYGRVKTGGDIIYLDNRKDVSDNGGYLDVVGVIADHAIHAVDEVWIDGQRVLFAPDGDPVPHTDLSQDQINEGQDEIQKKFRQGNTSYAHIEFRLDSEAANAEPFPQLKIDSGGKWNSADPSSDTEGYRGTGLALFYFRGKYKQDVYPRGLPELSFVVQGNSKIHDPRNDPDDPDSPPSIGYSDNIALCTADYLLNRRGLSTARAPSLTAADINITALNASAETCDIPTRTYDADGVRLPDEPQFVISAVISSGDRLQDVIEELAQSMAGAVFYSPRSGWRIEAAEAFVPEISITEADIIDTITQFTPRTPQDRRYNTVNTRYTAPDADWAMQEAKEISNQGYIDEDGAALPVSLDLPFVSSQSQALRIAWQYLRRARAEWTLSFAIHDPEKALRLNVWDVCLVSLPRFDLEAVRFKVIEAEDILHKNNLAWRYTVQLDDPESYDREIVADDITLASYRPNNLLPSTYAPQIGNLKVVSGIGVSVPNRDGTIITRALVSWNTENSPYRHDTIVRYNKVGDDQSEISTRTHQTYLNQLEAGQEYIITAAHRNRLGAEGESRQITHLVQGKGIGPTSPLSLSVVQIGNLAVCTIAGVEDPDIAAFIFRGHTVPIESGASALPALSTIAEWSRATVYDQIATSQFTAAGIHKYGLQLPTSGYYILGVRAIDSSGNLSTGMATDIFSYTNLLEQTLHVRDYAPEWPGIDTSLRMANADGNLMSAGFMQASNSLDSLWIRSFAGRPSYANHIYYTPEVMLDRVYPIKTSHHLVIQNLPNNTDDDGNLLVGTEDLSDTATVSYEYRAVPGSGDWLTIQPDTNAQEVRAKLEIDPEPNMPFAVSSFVFKVEIRSEV